MHDPSIDIINPLQLNYLQNYVTAFETALSGANFSDPALGYEAYIDVPSFIDFMLINEITKNVDGYRISTFYHKQHISNGGKIFAGPIWDFNLAFGNSNYCEGNLTTGWEIDFNSVCGGGNPFHWNRLVQDPDFTYSLNCRWQELRQSKFHEDTLFNYIDSMALYLQDASYRNFSKWQTLGTYVWPNNFVGNTYQEEIDYLKAWISARLAWMDANMFGSCNDLGITDQNQNSVTMNVYPNPFYNTVQVSLNKNLISGKVLIYSVLGEVVYEQNIIHTNYHVINTENLSQGVYVIKLFENSIPVSQVKIIKN